MSSLSAGKNIPEKKAVHEQTGKSYEELKIEREKEEKLTEKAPE